MKNATFQVLIVHSEVQKHNIQINALLLAKMLLVTQKIKLFVLPILE